MEKRKAHYALTSVKKLIEDGKVSFTKTALVGGAAMGFDAAAIVEVVSGLTTKCLYKSMTSHADHKTWHDVYHVETEQGEVYLKLTVVESLLIVSFKEKGE